MVGWATRTLPKGARILDVAAGRGALSKALLDADFAVSCTSWDGKVEVDIPKYFCNVDLPFGLETLGGTPYDLVCAIEIVEHAENAAGFLRSCASLLKPGGYLLVSTPNVENASARLQWLIRGRPASFAQGEVEKNRHITMLWKEGLEYLISLAGFTIVEKQFPGNLRLGSGPAALVKRGITWAMTRLLPGELSGTARLYVLRRNDTDIRTVGPGDVY